MDKRVKDLKVSRGKIGPGNIIWKKGMVFSGKALFLVTCLGREAWMVRRVQTFR